MSDVASPAAPAPTSTETKSNVASAPSSNTTSTSPASGGVASVAPTGKSGTQSVTTPNSKLADAPTPAPGSETKAEKAERLKFQLKVKGQMVDEEYTHEQLQVRLQKALAADQGLQETAETRKAFAAFREAFEKDPFEATKNFAPKVDLDALAEKRLIERFQQEELQKQDPGAYEKQQLQKQLDEYKSQDQKRKDAETAKAQAEQDAKDGAAFEKEFMQALEETGLPKDRRFLHRLAQIADTNLDHGIELTSKQMAQELNEQIRQEHQHVTRSMKGESLIKHLGDDVVREVLKYSVEKHKAKQSVVTAPTAKGDDTPEQKEARKLKSGSEIRDFFRKLKDGQR